VVGTGSMHVNTNMLDNIEDVGASESVILQGSDKTMIYGGIVYYKLS
jgi:hypothetical protein